MADIELVIKIPEEVYELIINDNSTKMVGFAKAVKNGTPLPKGHGKLIDVDNIQEIELEDSLTILTHTKGDEVAWHIDAPTVIEADKAERHTCGECQYWGTVNCSETYREPTKNDNACESFKAESEK